MKRFNEFRKTVETGVDPRLLFPWESNYYPRIVSPKDMFVEYPSLLYQTNKKGVTVLRSLLKDDNYWGSFGFKWLLRKLREMGEFF